MQASIRRGILWLAIALATVILIAGLVFAQRATTDSIVGAWGRFVPGAPGIRPYQIFEVRGDGTFVTHGPPHLQDYGTYELSNGRISVRSGLIPGLGGAIAYDLPSPGELVLQLPAPLNEVQRWYRITWEPFFELERVADTNVPSGVPMMVQRVIAHTRATWHDDARPERLVLEAEKNGEFKATLDLVSRNAGRGLRYLVSRFTLNAQEYAANRTARTAFPPTFMDMPDGVRAALAAGAEGSLHSARLSLTPEGRSTWGFTFRGGRPGTAGRTVDAVTGQSVAPDIALVMADYEAQWNAAIASLNAAARRNTHSGATSQTGIDLGELQERHRLQTLQTACEYGGGRWASNQCF